MRLLYLNPTASMGGAERVLLDLLTTVRRDRPDWGVGLIVANDGPLAQAAQRLGVTTRIMPFPRQFARIGDAGLRDPFSWLRFLAHAVRGSVALTIYLRHLRRAVSAFAPNVVHSNGIKMHLLSALSAGPRTSVIWHFHDYLGSRRVASRMIQLVKSRCNAIIAVSDSVAEDIRRQLGARPPVRTIRNAVDLEHFTPEGPSADLDQLSGLPPADADVIRVGLVATFARWKGHMLFLDVMGALRRQHNVRGYIVGGPLYETDGSQYSMAELRSAIARLGIVDAVGLTGFVDDAAQALRRLDVVVHASTSPEPFGLVVAEAMATARPVVVSDAGGVSEFVDDERSALVYACGDAAALTRQIERLIVDPSLRRRLAVAAREAAVGRFDQKRMARELFAVYADA